MFIESGISNLEKPVPGFEQVFPVLPKHLESFVKSIYGKDINLFKKDDSATNLLKRFYSLALDPGLRKEVEFMDKKLPPVAVFNRQAFLSQIREKIGFTQTENNTGPNFTTEKEFKLFHLDIEKLRSADQAVVNEHNAADYNLNLVATSLNTAAEEIKKRFNINSENIIVGRYGGDEFDIGVVGNLSSDATNEIKKIILTHVQNNKGWFKVDKVIKQQPIRIKEEKIEEITTPKDDEINKRIFLSFLQRGMVLNEDQLEKEKDYFIYENQLNEIELNKYLKEVLTRDIYPTDIKDDDFVSKTLYLIRKNQELAYPFYLAQITDSKEGNGIDTRQKKLLKFVENSLFDPLLDEVVVSKPDLKERIEKGKYDKVFNFEIKLKEINDFINYSTGDRAIISLWKGEKGKSGLKYILQTYLDEDKIDISRSGGALFVCVKKGVELNSRVLKTFAENGIKLSYRGEAFNYALGYSETDLSKSKEDQLKTKVNEIMSSVSATEDWFNKVFTKLVLDPEAFDLFVNLVKPGPLQTQINTPFEITNKIPDYISIFLYGRYFTEKRWRERISDAQAYSHFVSRPFKKEKDAERSSIIYRADELQDLLVSFFGEQSLQQTII